MFEKLRDDLESSVDFFSKAVVIPSQERDLLRQIKELCERAGV